MIAVYLAILYTDEKGGKTNYLPIRAISELLGVEIKYDSATKTVRLEKQPTAVDAGALGQWSRSFEANMVGYTMSGCNTTQYHLQGLAALLALADGAGEHRAAAKGGGEGLGGFALGREAAEDGVLAVVTYNFRALFSVVLFQLGKALDDGHQRQPAGAARTEQGQDVEGRHGAQLIAEQHHAVLESAVMLVRHGEQLTGEVLDHKARDEILGGVFLRQNEKNGALL